MTRYVAARAAVLSRSSVNGLVNDLILFGEFLAGQFPDITSLTQLERRHIEAFLAWNRTRPGAAESPATSVSPSQSCTAPC